jgi:(p)ppGpp synthase/HD superfamily hydrolase
MSHKNTESTSIVEIAKNYAIERHKYVNQTYDIHPYSFHLDSTYRVAKRFIHLISEKDRDNVLAGCWVHDVIEDTRQTHNDVKKATNETVAEYSYVLTNPKGKNRKERNSPAYYNDIKGFLHASFIKLCDRIANLEYSLSVESDKFVMYKKEHKSFRVKLYDGRWKEMWDHLEKLIK